jgi:hypothetical protein
MIRPLRHRHRRIVILLGMFLPVAFVVGIAARKPPLLTDALPVALAVAPQKVENVQWQRADLFAKSPVQVRLLRGQNSEASFAVAFTAKKEFVKPDLLVYWVAGDQNITDTLPGKAQLLGVFDPFSPLPLPAAATTQIGRLILYSLANNEIVDESKFIEFNDSSR